MTRPDWDEWYIDIAHKVAERSTCLRRQCGAVIVRDQHIISTGYNGAPRGLPHCSEIGCLRDKLNVPSGQRTELCNGAHAEQNAINFAARDDGGTGGATLYSTHYPCSWCVKSIINAGIIYVVYDQDYPDPLTKTLLRGSIDIRNLTGVR